MSHAFADEYDGERWQVRCAGKADLRLALAELATPIGIEFTDTEKKNADLQFERTRRELKKLADAREPHRCLLILDNMDCLARGCRSSAGFAPSAPAATRPLSMLYRASQRGPILIPRQRSRK